MRIVLFLKAKLTNKFLKYSDANKDESRKLIKVADSLLEIEKDESNQDQYNSDEIKQLVGKTIKENHVFIEKAKADYQKLNKLYDDLTEYLNSCKIKEENFNSKIFHEKINNALTFCKETKEKYFKYSKEEKNKLQEARRKHFKYDISKFTKMITIAKLSSLFMILAYVGGYLYLWALFNLFSFKFNGFFSYSDYILSPLNQIIYGFIFLIFIFLYLFLKKVDINVELKYSQNLSENKNKKFIDLFLLLPLIYLLTSGILNGNNVELLIVLVIAICFYGIPFFVSRYFKSTETLIETIIFVICFLFYVGIILLRANTEYLKIINSSINSNIEIVLVNGEVIANQLFVLKNSEYYFLYNKDTKNITAIPKNKIFKVTDTQRTTIQLK